MRRRVLLVFCALAWAGDGRVPAPSPGVIAVLRWGAVAGCTPIRQGDNSPAMRSCNSCSPMNPGLLILLSCLALNEQPAPPMTWERRMAQWRGSRSR
jgi:hypothetical protein